MTIIMINLEDEIMKVFVTKYALSRGIQEIEVEDCGDGLVRTPGSFAAYFHKGEHFTDLQTAVEDAETRRMRKIISVKKQLAKLENMKFA